MNKMGSKRGLRGIAILEAVKGALVLFVACGMPWLTQHQTARFVEKLVKHFHLNPAHRTPQVFLKLADKLDSGELWWLAAGAVLYATVRFVEAYGLWRARRWAEWLGCVGAAMYIPLELKGLHHHPGPVSLTILITNLIVVFYLALCLKRGVGKKALAGAPTPDGAVSSSPSPSSSSRSESA
jgi:uncharacterized membrane protein (DUF2068 family)